MTSTKLKTHESELSKRVISIFFYIVGFSFTDIAIASRVSYRRGLHCREHKIVKTLLGKKQVFSWAGNRDGRRGANITGKKGTADIFQIRKNIRTGIVERRVYIVKIIGSN